MDALALESVQVPGEGRHEGLALAGLHLGDVALVQGRPTHQLHVEMTLPDRPPCGLSDGSERFGQEVVERLTVRDAFLERDRVLPELVVAQVLDLGLVGIHELREVGQVLQFSAFADVGDLVEYRHGGSFGLLRASSYGTGGAVEQRQIGSSSAPSRSTSRAFSR